MTGFVSSTTRQSTSQPKTLTPVALSVEGAVMVASQKRLGEYMSACSVHSLILFSDCINYKISCKFMYIYVHSRQHVDCKRNF